MKIEAEVHTALYPFSCVEGGGGGRCSSLVGELPPIAQGGERPSIGRPDQHQPPPGCGSAPEFCRTAGDPPSVFDCEHFQFIDEDEEDSVVEEACPTTGSVPEGVSHGTSPDHLPAEQLAEVSSPPQQQRDPPGTMSSESKSHAVKRQVSFNEATITTKKAPKSLLKKKNSVKKPKGRVTFDEAVKLFSDEVEGVQLLALTTGPDLVYTDAFYMFEPPIEYQDVPPFEPPAEYRDLDAIQSEALGTPDTVEEAVQCTPDTNGQNSNSENNATTVVAETSAEKVEVEAQPPAEEVVAVLDSTEKHEKTDDQTETKVEVPATTDEQTDSSKESAKLFERFLEAEREFAIDEELNSVFQELDSDFTGDAQGGTLDDNFFRKLITLLSSAEGDGTLKDGDFFSDSQFSNSADVTPHETEDDENIQTHSRTISEADSDCSISSQDTIIVRLGEDDNEQTSNNKPKPMPNQLPDSATDSSLACDIPNNKIEVFDEVFSERFSESSREDEKPRPLPRESLVMKNIQMHQAAVKLDKTNEESLSRQSSSEQSVNSGTSQDPPQDADDSTSSDSRSGEIEGEMRLDDIGYDEEDADDYDEESLRGIVHGNSKIRRIIKKNVLQCSLFRGIEAKRRQQTGAKYSRPKSPLLSQESLVEKLKWLTTIDEHKDGDGPVQFRSKPPDVILSASGIPVNGSMQNASSENNIHNQNAMNYQQFYPMQRFAVPANAQGGYYVRHDGYHPSLPRQRMACSGHPPQMNSLNMQYPTVRMVSHPGANQVQWPDQRNMTVPRNFRDWRVIQRVSVNRNGEARGAAVPADFVRCSNGSGYPSNVPPDVSRTSQTPVRGKDELEQFVEQDSKRLEKLRKRYSLAEDDDDPTFGFARRPSVRGVQSRFQTSPSENVQGLNKMDAYAILEETGQGPPMAHPRPGSVAYTTEQMRAWSRDPNWRLDNSSQTQIYGSQPGRSPMPMHIHRASVALTELPGNATIPYTHRKPHPDPRYHSYAESMYGSTRTLPTKGWAAPPDTRQCHNVPNAALHQTLHVQQPQMLQVPPHPSATTDERGVPEGASSSPKISSDSLYHSPVPDSIKSGGSHKDEGVIYYSLNV